jgi:tRNA1Val (adenine37-N6)-methyltransferase
MGFAPEELTTDAFLGGRLAVRQPRAGYRAGVDPVLLAAAVPARAGEAVLELGLGTGVASLCLGRRVAGVVLAGIELQADYAALARENAAANGIALEVVEGDIAGMPAALRSRSFDHVIANPPYFRRAAGTPARDAGREAAFGEATALGLWIEAGMRRLRPGGRFTLIQRVERLPDLLAAFDGRPAALTLLPIAPRVGREATLVILAAVKGGGAPFRLLPPLVLHEGPAHLRDGDDYAAPVRAVLREAAALPGGLH